MDTSTRTAPFFMSFSIARVDELRRAGARDQHGADHDVGCQHFVLDRLQGRGQRADPALEHFVERRSRGQRTVDDGDVGTEACGHPGSMGADDTAAEHDDLRRP